MPSSSSPLRSLLWSGLDTVGTLLVGIVSVLAIARLIGDEAFGLGSIALGLVLIVTVVVSSLVHDALVRHPQLENADVDTAVTASLLAALVVAVGLALLAVPLGRLLEEPRLAPVLWALLPMVPFSALSQPLIAERRNALDFATVGRQQLAARFTGLAAGLTAAALGAGVWSIVAQQVVTTGHLALALLRKAVRKPRLRLEWARLKPLLTFCQYVVWAQLVTQACERMFVVAIGYWHGLGAAGQWGVATRLSESLTGAVMHAIYHVALAYMARLQTARDRLLAALEEAQRLLTLAALPVLAALSAGAEPLVRLLLGEGWTLTPQLLLGCLLGSFMVIRRLMPIVALNAIGRPEPSMSAMVGQSAAGGLGLILFGALSPLAIALVRGMTPVVGVAIVARAAHQALGRSVWREAFSLAADLAILATATGTGIWLAGLLETPSTLAALVVAAGGGASVAAALALLVRPKTLQQLSGHLRAGADRRLPQPAGKV